MQNRKGEEERNKNREGKQININCFVLLAVHRDQRYEGIFFLTEDQGYQDFRRLYGKLHRQTKVVKDCFY